MQSVTLTVVVLVTTLLMAASLAGLGALALRFRGEPWADLPAGWGVLGLVLLLTSRLGLPITPVALPLLLAGLLAFGWRCRTWPGGSAGRPALLLALLLAPLLVMAAAMPITAWDDYSHWLANGRFLLEHDSFPRIGLPQPSSWHGGYPYGVALITAIASLPLRLLGLAPMAETGAAVFALLLLGGLVVGIAVRPGRAASAWAVALALLLVVWLNPAFVPRIVFTNYGEAPTAALLGVAALLLLRQDAAARWQAALVLAAIVNVKQTGLVLALLLLAGAALLALRDRLRAGGTAGAGGGPARSNPASGSLAWALPLLAGPMLLTWWLWQPHAAAAGGVFGFKPLAEWCWPLAAQTLASISSIMLRKIGFTLLLLATLGLAGLAAWRGRRDAAARLALLAAPVLAGWPCFLFVTYMGGSFAPDEVTRAASFWRYGTQLGGLVMAVAALWLLALLRAARPLPLRLPARLEARLGGLAEPWLGGLRQAWRRGLPEWGLLPEPGLRGLASRRWALPAVCAVLLLLPVASYSHLWPHQREPAPPLRRTLAALIPAIPRGSVVAVVDPAGNGFGAVVTSFALHGHARVVKPSRGLGYLALDGATLHARLAEDQAGLLLLLSTNAPMSAALGTPALPRGHWRLLSRDHAGWTQQAAGRLGYGE